MKTIATEYNPGAISSFFNGEEEDKPKKRKKRNEKVSSSASREESKESTSNAPKAKKQKTSEEDAVLTRKRVKPGDYAPKQTIFVGNLPLSYTEKKLKSLFKDCGKIDSVRFRCAISEDPKLPKKAASIKKKISDKVQSLRGYVRFANEESVIKALLKNGQVEEGRHIRVDSCASKQSQYDSNRSIFIANMPYDAEEENLREHFQDCGDIEAVRIVRDKYTGEGKGFGFVEFKDRSSVSLALKLSGEIFEKRNLKIKPIENAPYGSEEKNTTGRGNDKFKDFSKNRQSNRSANEIPLAPRSVKKIVKLKRKMKGKKSKSLMS